MCKYCELTNTGVPGERTNEGVSIGSIVDGSQIIDLIFFRYLDEENGDWANELIIDKAVGINSNKYTVKSERIRINYCPFCGEEL